MNLMFILNSPTYTMSCLHLHEWTKDSSNNSQAATTGFPSTNSLPLDTTATGDLGSMDPSTSSQAQTTPNSNPNNTTDITTTTVSQLESTSTSSTTSNDGTSTIAKSNDEGGSNNGLPAAIAGLVVGLLLLIILSAMIAVNVLFCVRRRGHSRTMYVTLSINYGRLVWALGCSPSSSLHPFEFLLGVFIASHGQGGSKNAGPVEN